MSGQKFLGIGYYAGMEAMYSKRIDELMAENERLRHGLSCVVSMLEGTEHITVLKFAKHALEGSK